MTITIGISFERAKAIKAEGSTFVRWTTNARMRGVSETTIKNVNEQWREGMVRLNLTIEEWSEIQTGGGE
jgi:hypothetical protein